ncbi:MAG TPA: hypothetical protein VE988_26405 [Gemmataceae bacterium]|nr:hypothetical protein [Gemmataceae bacterium]
MSRYLLTLAALVLVHQAALPEVSAQDNAIVRRLVTDVIKKELAAHDSKEKGWHQGNTWLWLDNPPTYLGAEISSLTYDNGRFTLEGRASAMIAFQHKVPLLIGSKTFTGTGLIYLTFKASAQAGERLTGSKVSIGRLEINDLRLHGNAVRPFQGLVEDGVNMVLRHKKPEIEKRLEESLNKVNLAGQYRVAGGT